MEFWEPELVVPALDSGRSDMEGRAKEVLHEGPGHKPSSKSKLKPISISGESALSVDDG